MKKRVIVICWILVVCIVGVVAIMFLGRDNEVEFNPVDDVTMEIVEGTLTNTGATIVITDLSGENNTYGEWYRIDKLEDGKWYELEDIVAGDVGWHMIGYSVGDDNQLTMDVDWEWLYGPLESGEYRIVKDFSGDNPYDIKHVAAEFTIE